TGIDLGGFRAGGGLYNDHAAVTLTRCTVSGNAAPGPRDDGGGIENRLGTVVLDACTVSGNSAGHSGGALSNVGNVGRMALTRCTIPGNTAPVTSAIDNNGIMTIDHCTSTGNVSTGGFSGGPCIENLVSLTALDSTIADNVGEWQPAVVNLGVAAI